MNISLTRQLEDFVQRKVASGLYTSASEVVREALRLLEEQERHKELRSKQLRQQIEEGWMAAERGEVYDGPPAIRHLHSRVQKKTGSEKKKR